MAKSTKEQLEQWYVFQGCTLQEVGDKLGVTRERVRQLMEREGIPRRHRHGHRIPYGFELLDNFKCDSSKRARAFESIEDQDTAYWVGLLLADGTIFENQVILSLGDKDHVIKFRHFLGCKSHIKESEISNWRPGHTVQMWKLTVCCKRMVKDLSQYGVVNGKTGCKRLLNIPQEYMSHFIRGFFDGDGCVCVTKPQSYADHWASVMTMHFTSNVEMITAIQLALKQHCGIESSKVYKIKQSKKSYKILYSGYKARVILEWMYQDANTYLYRKKKKYDDYLREYSHTFRKT